MEKILITTSFGLESLVKFQLRDLGYKDYEVSDGLICLMGNLSDIAKLNINLKHADRVYQELSSFQAMDFEELFDNIKKISWQDILNEDSNFIVNARSYKSKLFSLRSIQSISEKAIIDKLKTYYHKSFFEKTGERVNIEIMIEKNVAKVCIDTSGDGLHKRGYREGTVKAPLRENLAAALVDLSFYNPDRFLFDGFCGSGTILIEAARNARNIAPGIDRDFDFTNFKFMNPKIFKDNKQEAMEKIDYSKKLNILGSDISGRAISLAKKNAMNAGVYEDISFITRDFSSVAIKDDYGVFISNPPYGIRLSDIDLSDIYKKINHKLAGLETWSLYFITADEKFDRQFNRKLSKKRKLYNGGQKVDFYQYFGKKPEWGGRHNRR